LEILLSESEQLETAAKATFPYIGVSAEYAVHPFIYGIIYCHSYSSLIIAVSLCMFRPGKRLVVLIHLNLAKKKKLMLTMPCHQPTRVSSISILPYHTQQFIITRINVALLIDDDITRIMVNGIHFFIFLLPCHVKKGQTTVTLLTRNPLDY
jgi:hypothetical protein